MKKLNANSCVFQVVENRANLTIGLYTRKPNRDKRMIPTIAYMQSAVKYAFRINIEFASPFSRLLAPFTISLWAFLISFVATSTLIVLFTKHLSSRDRHFLIGGRLNRTPIFNMLHLMFEGAVANPLMLKHTRHFGTFSRSLTMIWILGFLIIRSAYQSSMYKYLQEQRLPSPYDTVDQVNRSGVIVNTTPEGYNLLTGILYPKRSIICICLDNHFIHLFENGSFFKWFSPCSHFSIRINKMVHGQLLGQIARKRVHGVTVATEIILNSFNKHQPVDSRLELSKETIIVLNNMFFVSKGSSVLSEPVDKYIQVYQEAGLIGAWVRRYAERIKVRNKLDKRQPKKLHVKHVLGAAMVYGILSTLSVIVFLMEIFREKIGIFERILDYLTY